jgi:ParB-like chromosome segregation protein Spo0J
MKHHHYPLRAIPLTKISPDPDSAIHSMGTEEEEQQLRASIKEMGILRPIIVSRQGKDHYLIIDGYRRFHIAQDLGLKTIHCTVNPPMSSGERAKLRFVLYHTFKPLTKAERTKQRRRLREMGINLSGEAA